MRPGMDRVPSGARGEGGEKAAPAGVQGWQESGGTGGTGGLWRGGVIPQHLRHSWKQEGVAGTESLQALKNPTAFPSEPPWPSPALLPVAFPFLSSPVSLKIISTSFLAPSRAHVEPRPRVSPRALQQGQSKGMGSEGLGLRLPLLSLPRDTRQAVPRKAAPSLPCTCTR